MLRHKPEKIGIQPDSAGWVSVKELLDACCAQGFPLTMDELQEVVRGNDKQRFAFSEDGLSIRANQGHSIEVELGLEAVEPPAILYHGTAQKHLASIRQQGLTKGKRHHVHLSSDANTATHVGSRHGKPVVLEVMAGKMHQQDFVFYLSANGVWLTDHVPVAYLTFPDD